MVGCDEDLRVGRELRHQFLRIGHDFLQQDLSAFATDAADTSKETPQFLSTPPEFNPVDFVLGCAVPRGAGVVASAHFGVQIRNSPLQWSSPITYHRPS